MDEIKKPWDDFPSTIIDGFRVSNPVLCDLIEYDTDCSDDNEHIKLFRQNASSTRETSGPPYLVSLMSPTLSVSKPVDVLSIYVRKKEGQWNAKKCP